MKNPLIILLRRLALRSGASKVPTCIMPLDSVRSATVLVYPGAEDSEETAAAVKAFFDPRGISVTVICPSKGDINWLGFLKGRVRGAKVKPRHEDLFISLSDSPEYFAAEYEARCSTALFKVGRFQLEGDIFDLVVSSPSAVPVSQSAAFAAIQEYLSKIQ